jgi:hypothetical protein
VSIGQLKFFSAIETDLVGPAFDGENSAQVTVATAERELEDPTKRVHRFFNPGCPENAGMNMTCCDTSGHSLMESASTDYYLTTERVLDSESELTARCSTLLL